MNRKIERRLEDAENAGRTAAAEGKDRFENPHYAFSREAEAWQRGYDHGKWAA